MLEIAEHVLPLVLAGEPVVAVTVTRVARSAPRGVGATMAVTSEGRVIGSISGGCVEGDCVMLAMTVLATGTPAGARFGFGDELARAAGLACGGSVDVLAYPLTPDLLPDLETAAQGTATTVAMIASGADLGCIIPLDHLPAALGDAVQERATRAVDQRESVLLREALDPGASTLPADTGAADLLLVSRAPRPHLIVLGASEHAAALCRVGTAAGFRVSVCDAWELLLTPARFPEADRLIVDLPHEYLRSLGPDDLDARTAVCVLTHDERLDVPALRVALGLPIGFVGALGARSTVARRALLLEQAGVPAEAFARLHSPLGLDLGGSSPEETALSILAEIVAARHGGTAAPLRERTGPLHRRADASDTLDVPAVACGVGAAVPV